MEIFPAYVMVTEGSKCFQFSMKLPVIQTTVDDGVVHCGAHGQPQHKQIDLLNGFPAVQSFIEASRDEIHMVRQPTDGKCHHHHNHHLHHLQREEDAKREVRATEGYVELRTMKL